jgi:molybdenum cofactor cytidylyltransferase
MNIDCLIPAAGFSSRMGAWKLLLQYKNSTIIASSIANALNACNRVIIVTGYRAAELTKLVQKHSGILTIKNENFRNGMFSSIQTGVRLIESEWFFITMGDMPDISKDIYINLLMARDNNPEDFDIIRPMYQGKRGHPVLHKKTTIQTIISEPNSSEMKNVFAHHRVLDIEMNILQTFRDIDTPEDYERTINTKI